MRLVGLSRRANLENSSVVEEGGIPLANLDPYGTDRFVF